MIRKLVLTLLVLSATISFDLPSTDAAPISSRNPYRSFNLSGVNYGSVRWEQSHGRRGHAYVDHRGMLFRRR